MPDVVKWRMDVTALLLDLFGRIPSLTETTVAGLEPEDLTRAPAPGVNTIGWLIWHLIRVQDYYVAGFLDTEQIWSRDSWAARFGLDPDPANTGYGHGPEDVASVRPVDADALLDYLDAVDRRTRSMLEGLTPADLGRIVDRRVGSSRDHGGAADQHRRRQPSAHRPSRLPAGGSDCDGAVLSRLGTPTIGSTHRSAGGRRMKPCAVHHVSINVDDVDAALAFYTGRLGLVPRTDRPDFDFPGAWLDAGGQQVHLIGSDPPTQRGQHFALQVEDLEAAITELRQEGIKVSDAVAVGTSRQAFLKDPAGNRIELHQVGASGG